MPSGPEGFVAQPTYTNEIARARDLLLAHPGRWRVIYHYDGDGIASASSAVRALLRLGYPFQATPLRAVERERMHEILRATAGPALIVDTGSSWLDLYAEHRAPVIVLDHHQYPAAPHPPELPKHVALVNPLDWGVDGMSEMCAATLTWLFTVFVDPRNWDNAAWGLSGAISDRQHVGGFKGVNGKLVDEAIAQRHVERRRQLALFGPTVGSALETSIDPYFAGLSGRPAEVERFLRELDIDPGRPLASLPPEETKRLETALLERLAHQGTRPEFRELLVQERWTIPALAMDAQELANLQNATGRIGEPGIGVALALGDAAALAKARAAENTWRLGVLNGLRRVEENGVHSLPALAWFESPDGTLAGTQAGMAMNYLLDPDRPVFVFTPSGDRFKLSARGTLYLVSKGLDLASACRIAAQLVQGEGGGHRVAAGATIPASGRDAFLAEADRLIAVQLRLVPEAAA
jgi:single-stranded-DNA-specific exonuclease